MFGGQDEQYLGYPELGSGGGSAGVYVDGDAFEPGYLPSLPGGFDGGGIMNPQQQQMQDQEEFILPSDMSCSSLSNNSNNNSYSNNNDTKSNSSNSKSNVDKNPKSKSGGKSGNNTNDTSSGPPPVIGIAAILESGNFSALKLNLPNSKGGRKKKNSRDFNID